jgi:ribonuclease III
VFGTLINFLKPPAARKTSLHHDVYALTGFYPVNIDLYKNAFTHRSVSATGLENHNERLEYLGDAVLSAVIAGYLFLLYPDCKEGFLTQLRSKLVNRENLNKVAVSMGLDRLIRIHKSTIPTKKHIFGNALEALIGAVYLDKGYELTKKFIVDRIINDKFDLDHLACEDNDFKSQIIRWGQKHKQKISFGGHELLTEDKTRSLFVATIHIMDMPAGKGLGTTKKEAQQLAAQQALEDLSS